MKHSFLVVVALLAATAAAYSTYQSKIPNGANVERNGASWPGVGHVASSGGGTRNPFGLAFAAAGHSWTSTLCNADTDGDGYTNGYELGDPSCTWTAGGTPTRTTGISHPGFADSIPSTTTVPPTTTTAATTAAPLAASENTSAGGAMPETTLCVALVAAAILALA
jgi:dopamine beta-monooxygenase